MKILFIDVNYKYGSTGSIVYNLNQKLLEKGFETVVLYGRGNATKDINVFKITSKISVYFDFFITRIFGFIGYGNFLSTFKAIKKIKKEKPDVINIHQIHGYYININWFLRFLKKSNIPVLITCHDFFYITGKCGYPFGCEKMMTECKSCPLLKDYPKSYFFDKSRLHFNEKKTIFNNWNNILFSPVSYWLGDFYKNSPISSKHIVYPIHNGINIDIFKSYEHNFKIESHDLGGKFIVLHVTANFNEPIKGGKKVIEIAERITNKNIVFIIVGIDSQIDNLPKNIINYGKTTNRIELAQLYSRADVTLLTSQYETFSLVAAESLCCGTPVIGFEAGAPSEVAPKGYGLFFMQNDILSVVNEINNLSNGYSSFLSQRLIEKFGREKYSIEVMSNNYFQILMELKGNT